MRAVRLSKWWIIALYWFAQGVVIYTLTPALMASAHNVDPNTGTMYAFPRRDYIEILTSSFWIAWGGTFIPLITLAQAIYVWPVRKPVAKRERGWPLKISLTIAALAIALLGTGIVLAVSQTIFSTTGFDLGRALGIDADLAWVFIAWCLLSWIVCTPLLIRFCRRGPREDILARLAARIFVGTVIETVAVIPLDAMVRRREPCYCLAGTYFALLICGGVGLFILGPAILLPLLARRRKRWYEGKCEWCAYDMRATPRADNCPECGMGWRIAEPEGAKGQSGNGSK